MTVIPYIIFLRFFNKFGEDIAKEKNFLIDKLGQCYLNISQESRKDVSDSVDTKEPAQGFSMSFYLYVINT